MFKNYLIASGKLIENSTFNNEFGYYLMSKQLKLHGMNTQKRVSYILVTKPGLQPPFVNDWARHIITVIKPSHDYTRRPRISILPQQSPEAIQTLESPKKGRFNYWDSPEAKRTFGDLSVDVSE